VITIKSVALVGIGLFIWLTVAVLVAAIYSALRRRKKDFAQHLKEKYGVKPNEDDEPWDETYGADDKKDKEDK
jgi:hypothetical protein